VSHGKLSEEDIARADRLLVAVLNGMLVRAELPAVPRGMDVTTPAGLATIRAYTDIADAAILMTLTALDRVDKVFGRARADRGMAEQRETKEAKERQ